MKLIRIGTRGSALAIRQAEIVADQIKKFFPVEIQIVTITTKGDQILNKTLDKIGGKGLFVKEIESALLNEKIDLAVHSMKDMPATMPNGLILGGVLEREDPRDCLVAKDGVSFWNLPLGAKIGTGSLRRKIQLNRLREDLVVVPIRGNIQTRMAKLEEGFDGVVLAVAGLKRLHYEERISYYFEEWEFLPAACQGILALQIRAFDEEMKKICSAVNHKESENCARAERAFLEEIGADCHAPIGAYCTLDHNLLTLKGMFYDEQIFLEEENGISSCPEELGICLSKKVLEKIKNSYQ